MTFNSFTFIMIFLPIVVFLENIFKKTTIKNFILFFSFLLFYFWGSPKFVILILLISIFTYIFGILIDKFRKIKKYLVVIYTLILVSILTYYKYADFIIRIINKLLNQNNDFLYLILPLGISFFTFQSLAYIYDVANDEIKAEKNILKVLCYLTFFPTITSGPILRYSQVNEELSYRVTSIDNIANGFRLFIIGLGKKLIIANNVAIIANLGFGADRLVLNWQIAWLSAIAYTLQIYFDFSGYSDMAIGVSKMLGFTRIKENFNYPYISKSISEFWRRWHISLGSWFKDYIYIPLGGNRVSKSRWLINIFIVWTITGLWHGASTIFIIWGLYFGTIIVLEKLFLLKVLDKLGNFISHLYSLLLITFGWIIFNCSSREEIVDFFKNLFDFSFYYSIQDFKMMDILYIIVIFVFAIFASTPVIKIYTTKLENSKFAFLYDVILVFILFASVILLVNNTYSPFIYFNF